MATQDYTKNPAKIQTIPTIRYEINKNSNKNILASLLL